MSMTSKKRWKILFARNFILNWLFGVENLFYNEKIEFIMVVISLSDMKKCLYGNIARDLCVML